jgi:Ca2+-binding RTX toxin-like protein
MTDFMKDAYLNSLTEILRENLIQNLAANHPLEKWIESDHLSPHPIPTPDDYPIDLKPSIIAPNRPSLLKSDLIQANSLSQDQINPLLSGYNWTIPTSRVLTYSFYESSVWNGSYYGSETGVTEVSEAVKTNVRQVLNWLETVINIDFQEVNETSTTAPVGKLRYMLSNGPGYAYAYYPTTHPLGGDVHLKPSHQNNSNTNGFERTAGNHGYMTLIHETLHGIGLKHPHEDTALATVEDNTANTVMSYRFTGNSSGTAMAYDLAALQYLYGTKAKETGDTSYQFTTRIDQFSVNGILSLNTTYLTKQTIWDTNGIDTLDFSTLAFENLGYRLDMNQGGWLTANRAYRFQQSINDPNVTGGTIQSTYFDFGTSIAYNVTLENLINSTSADTIYANDAANTFQGYITGRAVGADSLWNTDSNDTLDLSAYSFNAVTRTQNGDDLVLGLGSNGSITVKNYYISPQLNIVYNSITLPTITLEVAPSSVTEDGTDNLIYTFTRIGSTSSDLTVNFDVSGNAVFSTDYSQNGAATFNNTNGSIIFNAGANIATFTLSPTDDTELETDEIIGIGLTSNSNYTIGTLNTVTSTILNDEEIPVNLPSVTLAVNPATISENGTPNIIYTFTRTGDATNPLTVNFSVDGTATWNSDYLNIGGSSFSSTVGSIIFGANSATSTLTIDPKADTLVENNETIGLTLTSSIDYTIGTPATIISTITNDDGDALDNILIGGSGKDNLNGKEGNDTLIGDAGNDNLNGGIGVDSLIGGLGNDIYVIDNLGDIFTENAGEGTDTLQTPFTFDITGTNLENLTLTGTGNINGTGDGNNNTLTGNAGNNTLIGGNGNDRLVGGNGNDRLLGDNGNDRLTGGNGLDSFVFASLGLGLDRITDFKIVDDTIELSASGFGGGLSVGIPDSSLLEVGAGITSANTAAQRLIFNTTTGALFFDADGNGALATATQFATLSANLALTTADFLVV